jgi:hypothetical protein
MDIYLTAAASQNLEAVRLLAPAEESRGLLLGHRRGNRFIVENILSSPAKHWPSPKILLKLDGEVGGKIIGFFILGSAGPGRAELLQPIGVGKVLVEGRGRGGKRNLFRGKLIDYEEGFNFRPIPVRTESPKD